MCTRITATHLWKCFFSIYLCIEIVYTIPPSQCSRYEKETKFRNPKTMYIFAEPCYEHLTSGNRVHSCCIYYYERTNGIVVMQCATQNFNYYCIISSFLGFEHKTLSMLRRASNHISSLHNNNFIVVCTTQC